MGSTTGAAYEYEKLWSMLCSSKPAVGCSVGFGGPYDMEKDGWGFGGSYDSEKLASTATNVGYKVGASLKMPEVASVVG